MKMLPLVFMAVLGYLAYDFYGFVNDEDSPLLTEQRALDASRLEYQAKEKKLAQAQEFYRTLEAKRVELRALSEQLSTMRATLSENVDIPSFMKLVLTEAKNLGIVVTKIQPLSPIKHQYYVEQPFDFSFQGVYVQLIAFLDKLSRAERIVRVDDFGIKPRPLTGKASKYVDLEGTIKVKSYYYLGSQEDEMVKSPGARDAPAGKRPGQPNGGAT